MVAIAHWHDTTPDGIRLEFHAPGTASPLWSPPRLQRATDHATHHRRCISTGRCRAVHDIVAARYGPGHDRACPARARVFEPLADIAEPRVPSLHDNEADRSDSTSERRSTPTLATRVMNPERDAIGCSGQPNHGARTRASTRWRRLARHMPGVPTATRAAAAARSSSAVRVSVGGRSAAVE